MRVGCHFKGDLGIAGERSNAQFLGLRCFHGLRVLGEAAGHRASDILQVTCQPGVDGELLPANSGQHLVDRVDQGQTQASDNALGRAAMLILDRLKNVLPEVGLAEAITRQIGHPLLGDPASHLGRDVAIQFAPLVVLVLGPDFVVRQQPLDCGEHRLVGGRRLRPHDVGHLVAENA